MTLRRKTVLIGSAALVVLILVLYAASQRIVSQGFRRVEDEDMRGDVRRVVTTISSEIGAIKVTDTDWAWWDDTYRFVQDRNRAYVDANLGDATFSALGLNLMLFLDRTGRTVWQGAFDLARSRPVPIPSEVRPLIEPGGPLLRFPTLTSSVAGIAMLGQRPMMVVSLPILTTNNTGPSMGTLIMGRYLDAAQIATIASQTDLHVAVSLFGAAGMSPDFQAARASLRANAGSPAIVRLGARTIAGYAALSDVYGRPALIVRASEPRTAYQQGQHSIRYFLASLLLAGLLIGALSLAALNRMVLSPLRLLAADLRRIAERRDPAARVSVAGEDELGQVASTINATLQSLEEARDERRAAEARHDAVVRQASDGIFLVDLQTRRLMEVNAAGRELLGDRSGGTLDGRLASLLVAEDAPILDRRIERVVRTGQPLTVETRLRRTDGATVEVEASLSVIAQGPSEVLCLVARNISERRAAERRLEHALEKEQEATRTLREVDQMKNTFLQAVSHDLRTPLTAVLGLALTLEHVEIEMPEEDRRDLLRRLASNARKLDRLLSDLLDVDRLSRGVVDPLRRPTNVGALIRRVVEELEVKDHPIEVQTRETVVELDEPKVERILENMVANAARHTAPGTRIWIREIPRPDGVLLAVEDEGPGVPDELKREVFEPFRQGPQMRPHAPGSGIGLSLVARFAELHGGRAWVEDRPGGGSSFRVFLPRRDGAALARAGGDGSELEERDATRSR